MRAKALLLVVVFVGIVGVGGLLSVHTAGVVIAPSYLGQTAVPGPGAPDGPRALTATAMTVSPPDGSGPVTVLRAFVSASRHGLPRAEVDFYLGTGDPVSLLCAATTGGSGEALCALHPSDVPAVTSEGFTGSYAGDAEYGPSAASWSPSDHPSTTEPAATTTSLGTTGTAIPLSGTAYTLSSASPPAT